MMMMTMAFSIFRSDFITVMCFTACEEAAQYNVSLTIILKVCLI